MLNLFVRTAADDPGLTYEPQHHETADQLLYEGDALWGMVHDDAEQCDEGTDDWAMYRAELILTLDHLHRLDLGGL